MKKLSILGSTGSIGRSTLDVVSRNKSDFSVVALAAGRNLDLLEQQIKTFRPEAVAVAEKKSADLLRRKINGVEILSGIEGVSRIASYEGSDLVVSAIVGSAGLMPTLAAVKTGKTVGLANKEALVMAGEIVMREAAAHGARIIPVDSEHSAVFQCIEKRSRHDIRRLILTASGGPFVDRALNELPDITAEEALRHPNWNMGKKITIDSATLMNKGFEVIEASWLFDMPVEQIDVLIHPQSIVHSIVEFKDRSCIAQMSMPDMRGPISYSLSYPGRINDPIPALQLEEIGSLTFRRPDFEKFPCLSYAYEAVKTGGTMPAVLNAANEVAVEAFLSESIRFTDMPVIIKKTIDAHEVRKLSSIDDVIEADRWAKETALKYAEVIKG